MTQERDRMAYLLAETILGYRDYERGPKPLHHVAEAATGRVEVDIRIESMVRGMIDKFWLDAASLASAAEAAIREATKEVSIEKLVKETVAKQIALVQRDIEDRIRKRIDDLVTSVVYEQVEDALRIYARDKARMIWDSAQKNMDR